MPPDVRPAQSSDISQMIPLLMLDAQERQAKDGRLWKISAQAPRQIETALIAALNDPENPVRQMWHVAEYEGKICGVVHAMLLPVPPIYAGIHGPPGLVLPDTFAAPDAPDDTTQALLRAAEEALAAEGARILLASHVTGNDWRTVFENAGYSPLNLYLSRTIPDDHPTPSAIRSATEEDISGIVLQSTENRRALFEINRFWEPHPDADARFDSWMRRSLTLTDRDMMVAGNAAEIDGYVIAQPASRLHFPPAHDIDRIGVIDDYFHAEMTNPAELDSGGMVSASLLSAAENAFEARNTETVFVVCPAGWHSKIEVLEQAGYTTAMTWFTKKVA